MTSKEGLVWKYSINRKYLVSENGDVFSVKTKKPIKSNVYDSGYAITTPHASYKGVNGSLHRIVYEAFVGIIPEGMQINHIDGNKLNNHISNLELCTPQENTQHAYRLGLAKGRKGEDHAQSKVTEENVLSMYELFTQGYDNEFVGAKFGLHSRYVSLIRHGRRWKYLFERENMRVTKSTGTLPFPLPKCVYIFNKCMVSKKPQDVLGKELGIDPSTVSRIRTGTTWKHLRFLYNLPENTYDWKDEDVQIKT